ncbi:MAG: integration host factor subunit beta [Spirochaetes bacterium GWD1_61_31]|nr:MAG: integration host factor subunit beta [Spirochaetes bacterium GWB1_60_80]OHD34786.1 MAG: integration host factor subunit beta [Spirochaetes bacterium GWC1_61_12]OHD41724.1 MAG: integration host factor subunit beta [Spirochaetes bacterium GWD1_61_31]OHD44610.1 MAG: integration host factor subunit beta [Spirochaetes bacterium GWE1_60_18]OHD57935.1 MAG: integration host factor subunit beta [Spirochaetes bacterium GWF1_60_12]HAP43939.1 integration host factor subunit beta [Spirochaetaceae b
MSGKITKADIIDSLYEKTTVSKKDIHLIIDGLFDEIKAAILQRHIVELRGFGTFEVKTRKGKSHARNPKTGEQVSVPDHGVASFRPGRELKLEAWKILSNSGDE